MHLFHLGVELATRQDAVCGRRRRNMVETDYVGKVHWFGRGIAVVIPVVYSGLVDRDVTVENEIVDPFAKLFWKSHERRLKLVGNCYR